MGSPVASYSTDLEDLLGRLRRLPDVWPRPPPIWVPRKLKQQVAAMLRESLEVAIGTAGAVDGSLDAEVAHRLARCMPQLFLRSPPNCSSTMSLNRGNTLHSAFYVPVFALPVLAIGSLLFRMPSMSSQPTRLTLTAHRPEHLTKPHPLRSVVPKQRFSELAPVPSRVLLPS